MSWPSARLGPGHTLGRGGRGRVFPGPARLLHLLSAAGTRAPCSAARSLQGSSPELQDGGLPLFLPAAKEPPRCGLWARESRPGGQDKLSHVLLCPAITGLPWCDESAQSALGARARPGALGARARPGADGAPCWRGRGRGDVAGTCLPPGQTLIKETPGICPRSLRLLVSTTWAKGGCEIRTPATHPAPRGS